MKDIATHKFERRELNPINKIINNVSKNLTCIEKFISMLLITEIRFTCFLTCFFILQKNYLTRITRSSVGSCLGNPRCFIKYEVRWYFQRNVTIQIWQLICVEWKNISQNISARFMWNQKKFLWDLLKGYSVII